MKRPPFVLSLTNLDDLHIIVRIVATGEGIIPDSIRERVKVELEFPQCVTKSNQLESYHHTHANGSAAKTPNDDEQEYYYRDFGAVD